MLNTINKRSKIKLFVIIILCGFIFAVFYHYYLGVYLGLPYPSNTFLFNPGDRFNDFFNTIKFTNYSPVNFQVFPGKDYGWAENSNYLPGTFLISNIFHAIKPFHHRLSLVLFIALFIVFIFTYSWKNLKTSNRYDTIINTIAFSFLTYPVLILIDRANFEVVIFILLCLFIYLYQKGKKGLSIIPLALAISMKLYPAVFLILLVSDRKYKLTFWAIMLSIGLMAFPLVFLMDGGFYKNYEMLISVLGGYNDAVSNNFGLDFGHSLYGLIKLPFLYLKLNVQSLFSWWSSIAFLIMFLLSLYIIFIEKYFWKKVTLLVISLCLLPYVSADYKLIHFYIPIFLFINATDIEKNISIKIIHRKIVLKGFVIQYCFIILFALLLIPKSYRIIPQIEAGVFLNPIIMGIIIFIILFSGFANIKSIRNEVNDKIKFLFSQKT